MATFNTTDALTPLSSDALGSLMAATQGPCVSIYLPTARKGPETRENGIRFKTLLQQAEQEMSGQSSQDGPALLADLHRVADDNDFWQHQLGGLAVFKSPELFMLVRLARAVDEAVAVANSFHVKPLVRILQNASRYQLLAITQKLVTLYEGDLDTLDVAPLHPDVPRTMIEALGGDVTGSVNVSHYGGMAHSGMFHGHHDKKDDRDVDLERFFRVIDKAVYEYHGRGGDLPLYLAAVVDYHDRFKKISHHPRFTGKGVKLNPAAAEVDTERLRAEMEPIIRADFDAQVEVLKEQFGNAKAAGQGSDDVAKVAAAAPFGRLQTLLLDAGKQVGGTVDAATGDVRFADISDPQVDDLLDDVAEHALRTGATVRVLPSDHMPTDTGVAAVFRY